MIARSKSCLAGSKYNAEPTGKQKIVYAQETLDARKDWLKVLRRNNAGEYEIRRVEDPIAENKSCLAALNR